jgi:hypothetical protein
MRQVRATQVRAMLAMRQMVITILYSTVTAVCLAAGGRDYPVMRVPFSELTAEQRAIIQQRCPEPRPEVNK